MVNPFLTYSDSHKCFNKPWIKFKRNFYIYRDIGTKTMRWKYIYERYIQIQICIKMWALETSTLAFLLMGFIIIITSAVNFATIRFINRASSLGFYNIFPFASIAILTVIQQLLPVIVKIYTRTESALKHWENTLKMEKTFESKVWRRKFQSMEPLSIKAGLFGYNLFTLKKQTQTNFNFIIMEKTIELIICFPEASLV